MKTKIYISMALMIIIAIAAVFWIQSCRKPVETIESHSISYITKELNDATTPEKAAIAINHLIEKTGIGIEKGNSDYQLYTIEEDGIANLATAQSGYNNKDTSVNIGTYFTIFSQIMDSLQLTSNNEWIFNCNLPTALSDLSTLSNIAKGNPENPNNALILTIISVNGNIPNQITSFDSTMIISPVQAFCFNLWVANKYGKYNTLKEGARTDINWCKVGCYAGYIAGTALCSALTGWWTVFLCKQALKIAKDICLANCHDQGGGK